MRIEAFEQFLRRGQEHVGQGEELLAEAGVVRVAGHDHVADVVGGAQQPDAADQVLLVSLLYVAAARIRITLGKRIEQLLQGDFVVAQPREIRVDFVLLDQPTQGHYVGHAWNQAQLAHHGPVLDGAQLHRGEAVTLQRVLEDLAQAGGDGAELRRCCSMGKETRASTSTAARPGALASTMTCVLVTSGKASMGRCVQATPPPMASGTARHCTAPSSKPRTMELSPMSISIDRMRQYGHEGTAAPVLIVVETATSDRSITSSPR